MLRKFISMRAKHRSQLLNMLAGLDQCCADADHILAAPVYADVGLMAEELRELLENLRDKVEEKLDSAAE